MQYIARLVDQKIKRALERHKSLLLLGARQTGKTTLLQRLGGDLFISFVQPEVRQRYEKNPSLLGHEIEALQKENANQRPLILLDEVQKVPVILDVVQDLIDKEIANFVLTGSSARKLRHGHAINLLPGRVVLTKLDPLTFKEMRDAGTELSLQNLLLYGSLPGILQVKEAKDRETDLASYVTIYLEEEVRSEAIVRNIGPFARFLEYAAAESGKVVNFRKLSQEIGVSHTTIASYYQILEDCLIVERIEPLTKSKTRKKLTKAQRYLFFDLGVRRLAAREGIALPKDSFGHLFEQFIGLELLRCARISDKKIQILFWRDPDGPEVDWVLEKDGHYVPVEVKWTASPIPKDIQHLKVFLREYPNSTNGYVICQTPRRMKLENNIHAIPWQEIEHLVFESQ